MLAKRHLFILLAVGLTSRVPLELLSVVSEIQIITFRQKETINKSFVILKLYIYVYMSSVQESQYKIHSHEADFLPKSLLKIRLRLLRL